VTGEVAPEVRLSVAPPAGAVAEAEEALPKFELGPVSGARVTLRAGFTGAFGVERIACATAPASGYAPGVEDLVFGRATQIARSALSGVSRLEPSAARATPNGFEQRLDGDAVMEGASAHVAGRHLFAFTGRGASAVVCSIVCVERVPGGCASSIDGATLEGALGGTPPPSLAITALFAGIAHPEMSLAALALAGAAVTWIVLARRPRSRSRLRR
jgi:hypothetical protein